MADDSKTAQVVAHDAHCAFCFDVVAANFTKHSVEVPSFGDVRCPLFVTWKARKTHKHQWELRGCIGTFSPMHLSQGLHDYAITSAFKDRRFDPLEHHELPSLQVTVSLLTTFQQADNYLDWTIGVHGITIDYTDERGQRWSATYLPEVCKEQGWTQVQCINSLVRKSGYRGSITEDLRQQLSVTRYQSSKHSMDYSSWLALRSPRQ